MEHKSKKTPRQRDPVTKLFHSYCNRKQRKPTEEVVRLNINIKIDAPELAGAIYALANALSGTKLQPLVNMEVAVAADPQPEVEKPKSERKQSEKVGQASEPPEPVKEEVPEAEQAPETPETEPQVIPSVVELRAAAQEKGKTQEGKAKIKALLNKFESKSISDVPEEYRASFLALLEAL